jgi:O-antigen/teichoic acid export membrane protein
MASRPSLVRNIFSNWTGYVVTVVIGFVLAPFVVHTLGDTLYGVWSIVGSLTGYLGLFDFGVRVSVVKYVSEYRARDDRLAINEVVNVLLLFYTGIFFLVILSSLALAALSTHWFEVPPAIHAELRYAIVLMGLNIGLSFFTGLFGGVLAGSQRYDILAILAITLNILRALAIFVVLSHGGRLIALCAIEIGYTLAGLFLKTIWCRRENRHLALGRGFLTRATWLKVAHYSGYMFLLVLAVRIVFYTDYLVIGTFLTAAHVTYYAIGLRLIEYLRHFIQNMSNVFNPKSSELSARGEAEALRRLMIRGSKFSLYITLPLGIGFIVFGEPFIVLWMGAEYRISADILAILMIPQFMALSQFTSGAILNGLGRHKFNALMALGEALANLVLSIAFVQVWGLHGVAWGTSIPLLLTQTFFLPAYTCRVLQLPLARYFREAFLRPLLFAVPYTALLLGVKAIRFPDTWPVFFLEVTVLGACYFALAGLFGIDDEEFDKLPVLKRIPLLAQVRGLLHRTAPPAGSPP